MYVEYGDERRALEEIRRDHEGGLASRSGEWAPVGDTGKARPFAAAAYSADIVR